MLDFSVTFFITIINVLVLFLALRAVLFKPVTKFMNDRKRKIQEDIDKAERDRREAKLLLEQYEKRIAEAEVHADEIIRGAREQAGEEADRIRAEARAEAERIAAAARVRLDVEQTAAMALFRAEAASLVVQAAGRFLKREFNEADSRRYAAEALNEFVLSDKDGGRV
jgi:F-type H+-transporting ATPase subunit b